MQTNVVLEIKSKMKCLSHCELITFTFFPLKKSYQLPSILNRNSFRGNQSCRAANSEGSPPFSSNGGRNGGNIGKDYVIKLNELLERGENDKALEITREIQGLEGGLRAFGSVRQVPKRVYSFEELKLNKIDTSKFLSPVDTTLSKIKRFAQISFVLGVVSAWQILDLDQSQLLAVVIISLFVGTADQIINGGGGEALILDSIGNLVSSPYRNRVALHEAGHFLISYLMGILPQAYTLNSLDAFQRYGAFNVQAGTKFVDFEFQREVSQGKLKSETLDKFTCIALAGVATEYLRFGIAEGGLADILQLDQLLRVLGFSQKKADAQVRWAVLNTVLILRRHSKVQDKLATAMMASLSVGECIQVIEEALSDCEDI